MGFQTTSQPFFGNHVEQFCTLVYIWFSVNVAMGSASRRRRIQLSGKKMKVLILFSIFMAVLQTFFFPTLTP